MFDTRLLFNLKDKLIVKLPYNDINENVISELKRDLCSLIEKSFKTVIILDFSKVVFIDSSGYAALLKGWFNCNSKGIKLIICGLNKNCNNILIKKGLDRFIEVFKDLETAISFSNNYILEMKKYCSTSETFSSIFGEEGESNAQPAVCKMINLKNDIKEKLNQVSYSI